MAEDETFESQDSGAAEAYPVEAGQIRKGGYIMIKVPGSPGRIRACCAAGLQPCLRAVALAGCR